MDTDKLNKYKSPGIYIWEFDGNNVNYHEASKPLLAKRRAKMRKDKINKILKNVGKF